MAAASSNGWYPVAPAPAPQAQVCRRATYGLLQACALIQLCWSVILAISWLPAHFALTCAACEIGPSQVRASGMQAGPFQLDAAMDTEAGTRSNGASLHDGASIGRLCNLSEQQLGCLYYAASAFCASMMTISARLAGDRGMPTWQLVFVRSVLLTIYALWRIVRTRVSPSGNKCAAAALRALLLDAAARALP